MNIRVGRLAPMVVVPAMLLSLAACGDDGEKSDGEKPSGDSSSAVDESTEEATKDPNLTIQPKDLPVAPVVNNETGALKDVDWDQAACEFSQGEQSASGTVKSSAKANTGYLVQISWTNATGDVRGLGYKVLRGMKPGEEREWEIEADVADGATQCVLYAVYGSIPKG